MYLDFNTFAKMGGDSTLAEQYNRLEFKARRLIDQMTHDRLAEEAPVRDSVRYCMFELISAIASDEQIAGLGGREIASMSNDGISATYVTGSEKDSNITGRRYARIIKQWLAGETTASGINLLYAGVDA